MKKDRDYMIFLISIFFGLSAFYAVIFFKDRFNPKLREGLNARLKNLYHERKVKKFEGQFVDGLTLMSNAIKSGLGLQQAIEMAATEMPNPSGEEFKMVLTEVRLWALLEEALANLEKRMRFEDLGIVIQSICILRETGGNIIETFEKITGTIRERQKVRGKIKVLTSQGIVQGAIIFFMPFFISFALWILAPEFIRPLFTTRIGFFLILIALFLETTGAILIRKAVTIKV